jgi:DNA-binding NarL/FixJ family response regulator
MIKILIADDHPLIREGLKKTLREEHDVEVVCEARNGREVLDLIDKHDLNVIVMDLSMPGINGLEVLSELKKNKSRLPVLILSMHPEERFAIRAFRAGAAGYLTKESAPQELINAIRKVVTGGKYITPSVAEQLAIELENNTNKLPHEILSNRELEVLCMIASDISINDIAEKLCLSVNTVHSYRSRILEKLKMKTDIELTHYALLYHLIDPL